MSRPWSCPQVALSAGMTLIGLIGKTAADGGEDFEVL